MNNGCVSKMVGGLIPNIPAPLPLEVQESHIGLIGKYGDIVSFPNNESGEQIGVMRDNGLTFRIPSNQQFVLVRPRG